MNFMNFMNFIIPTDELHDFSEGLVAQPPTSNAGATTGHSFVRVIVVGGLCIGQGKWWSRRKFAETTIFTSYCTLW